MKDSLLAAGVAIAIVLSVIGLVGGNAKTDSIFEQPTADAVGAITSTTKAIIKAAGFISAAGNFTLTSGNLSVGGSTSVETFTQGGGIRATSTDDTSATFLASDFDVENMIEFTPNVTGITATLPATSTLSSIIPNASDHRDIAVCNATTTAAAPFTLAFGTGMNSHLATSTLAIESGDCATLNLYRATDTDIEVFYDYGY